MDIMDGEVVGCERLAHAARQAIDILPEIVQGNITYRNRTLWETVNRELAFNDNTKPFEEAFASYNIDIW